MAGKKHIKDYRLVETVDERGRIHTSHEYIGSYYRFALEADELRREKRLYLALCAVAAAAFLAALVPRSAATRTLYTALPFVFSALPLGIAVEALVTVFRAKPPLESIHVTRLERRVPASLLSAAVLSGVSLPGELVSLFIGVSMTAGDIVFSLCAAVECAACLWMFTRRGRLSVTEI